MKCTSAYGEDCVARTSHAVRNKYSKYHDTRRNGNEPVRQDYVLKPVAPTGTVSGKVTHLTTGEPVEGVRVFALEDGGTDVVPADLSMPGLANADFKFADVDTTDANGEYELTAPAGALNGNTTTIFAYRSGMFFTPDRVPMTISAGQSYPASFQGLRLSTITGRIMDEDGTSPAAGVTVTAVGGTANVTRTATTTANGRYIIRVPWGPYTVTPSKGTSHHDTFDPASLQATLGAEENKTLQNFEASGLPLVTVKVDKATIVEAGGAASGVATITASVSKALPANSTVTVTLAYSVTPSGNTAAYTAAGTSLTIVAPATASTETVTITGDDDVNTASEVVKVTVTADDDDAAVTGLNVARLLADPNVSVTITDDDAVPSTPGGFTATAGDTEVTLNWNFPTDVGMVDGSTATITEFQYCEKTGTATCDITNAGDWTSAGGGGATSFTVTGLTNDTEYSYQLRAVNGTGNSLPTAVVKATPKAPSQ